MADFLQTAYDFYLKKGYAPHQAAALAGNSVNEANSPTQLGDKGTALGRFQWRGDRQQNLYKFAADNKLDPESDEGQLEFANHELNTTEKPAGDKLRAAPDLASANDAVVGFLRPGGYTPDNPQGANGYVNRYNSAASLINATPMTQTLAMGPSQNVSTPADPAAAQDPSTGLLAWGAAQAQGDPMAAQPSGGLLSALAAMSKSPEAKQTQTGLGLLAASQPQQQQSMQMQVPQAQVHRPQMEAAAMPNFIDPLLKQKLYGLLGAA